MTNLSVNGRGTFILKVFSSMLYSFLLHKQIMLGVAMPSCIATPTFIIGSFYFVCDLKIGQLFTGRMTVNADPSPGVLSTLILPPIRSSICLTRARPRPFPYLDLERSL